jgi:hypothetical protein
MVTFDAATPVTRPPITAAFDQGTQLGKRYAEADLEILRTRPGQGSISVGTELLPVLKRRKLPSSD